MSNNILFLNKYKELENLIKHRLPQNNRNSSPIYSYIRELYSSPYEKDHYRGEKLDSIRELRNQMAHNNIDDIISIQDDALIFLENEISLLSNPTTALDICTKLTNIHYATLNSKIVNVMSAMIKYGYSHIPVLNELSQLIGVFSENTIFSIYMQHPNLLNKDILYLSDIEEYLYLNNHQTECFLFTSKNTLASKIISKFQKRKEKNKRISVIFVTENGEADEVLIGMITPYDALIK